MYPWLCYLFFKKSLVVPENKHHRGSQVSGFYSYLSRKGKKREWWMKDKRSGKWRMEKSTAA